MRRVIVGLAGVGLLLNGTAAGADTALVQVTPQNLKRYCFELASRAVRNRQVEFVIRRDVSGIEGPGTRGYVSDLAVSSRSLGTPVKLQKEGTLWTFRFSVPEAKVAKREFTLWGRGLHGEGVTYRFRLGEFWKSGED